MTIDTYTKFVMTIIAGALVVIALKGTGIIPMAFAHSGGVHKIAICDGLGKRCASIQEAYPSSRMGLVTITQKQFPSLK